MALLYCFQTRFLMLELEKAVPNSTKRNYTQQ
uniref:Uncharacterized protein n=1 Tax=Rhizophora mucronata TaxID=61149 RepID=A0A2P2R3N7_RHIMU